jgi:hypothetical protein
MRQAVGGGRTTLCSSIVFTNPAEIELKNAKIVEYLIYLRCSSGSGSPKSASASHSEEQWRRMRTGRKNMNLFFS